MTGSTFSPAIDPGRVNRLLAAHYLLRKARAVQSSRTAIAAGEAVLQMHDACEIVMCVVTDELGKRAPEHFMKFWEIVANTPGGQAPDRGRMDKLNALRNGFKHKGIFPNPEVVRDLLPVAESFCNDICHRYVQVDFERISLADLITADKPRERVKDAERLFDADKKEEALQQLRLAFDEIQKSAVADSHMVLASPPPRPPVKMSYDRALGQEMKRVAQLTDNLARDYHRTAATINMLVLGIDPNKYRYFSDRTPQINYSLSGDAEVIWTTSAEGVTRTEFDVCRDFVVDVALRTGELFRAEPKRRR